MRTKIARQPDEGSAERTTKRDARTGEWDLLRRMVRAAEESAGILAGITDAVIVVNLSDSVILLANPVASRIFGYSNKELVGQPFSVLLVDSAANDSKTKQQVEIHAGVISAQRFRQADGTILMMDLTAAVVTWSGTSAVVLTLRDVKDRIQAEERIRFLAHHDVLTELANRDLFADRLIQAMTLARRQKTALGLVYLDLDRFKPINDRLGHAVGDAVLKEVSRRLVPCVREADTVARLGGDEFAIVAHGLGSSDGISQLCSRLIETLTSPIIVDTHECSLGVSIGVSLFPSHGDDFDSLLRLADAAMYIAKGRGGNSWLVAGLENEQL